MTKLPYLNLGCGVTYDERWTNIDFVSTGPGVIAHNLLHGIPCADASFEVVYHSHMLEHFPKAKAAALIRECYRVLKPGGVLRVAVPDLERIAMQYLRFLNEGMEGRPGAREKYEWMVIELLDQMVRNEGGGEMLKYAADTSKNNDAFLLDRCGHEMTRLFEAVREKPKAAANAAVSRPSLFKRAAGRIRRVLQQQLLGDEYALLQQARFRNSGEIHQWMYDRYSLGNLLLDCGFKKPIVRTAFESAIPRWQEFRLDGENNVVRKPDSLFMEAEK